MIQLGLIGYPLGHSLSPRIHTAALQSCGLEGRYSLFPIVPDDERALRNLLAHVRSGEIHGLNVTIPHKQTVIPYLDQLAPAAEAIGAVNTISLRENKLVGENTDGRGFLSDLNRWLTTETQRHGEACALVLGAGGSARAVIYALLNDGWDVTVASRRRQQAQEIAGSFPNQQVQQTDFTFSNTDLSNISLVVNTTPVGMAPATDQSPWPSTVPLPKHAAIYDLIYNPIETKLVREAHEQGVRAITGLGMLVEQAALSFEIWTNQTPSRAQMRAAADQSPRKASNYQLPITNPGAQ
jgi:shikimate dehydrogenase